MTRQHDAHTLQARAAGDISLPDALSACRGALTGEREGDPIALLYSPRSCTLGVLGADGAVECPAGETVELAGVFEARVFGRRAELRWLRTGPTGGRAVWLSEEDAPKELEKALPLILPPIDPCRVLEQTYLLWGNAVEALGPGWTRLREARIGRLDVPVALATGGRAQLAAREYLVREPDHGNVYVAEERLLGLEVCDG